MISEPQPVSLAPRDREILIYAPSLSCHWLKAIWERPRRLGSTCMRWKVFLLGNWSVAHRDFKPDAWLPL
jgi:hypothetical protein